MIKEVKDIQKESDKFLDKVLFTEVWSPAVDIYETEDEMILLVELAGVKPKDINLSLDKDNVLHIWGKRHSPLRSSSKNCHGMELHFGTFSRYVKLLSRVERKKAELKSINGIYKITFKKK